MNTSRHRGTLRHRAGLVVAALLLLTGIAAFVGVDSARRDAADAIDDFYDETAFADLTISGGEVETIAARARELDGVAAVDARTTASLAVWFDDGATKLEGQIIGVPDSPTVDELVLDDGKAASGAEAVVEHHTASDLGVEVGDTVELLGLGGILQLKVSGIATSPEYLVPAASQQQLLTASGSFAVLFLPEAVAAQAAGAGAVAEAIVRYEAGADRAEVTGHLRRLASRHGAFLVEPRAEQPSNAIVDEELTGYREAALVAPWLLLATAALVAALTIGSSAGRISPDGPGAGRTRLRAALLPTAIGTVLGVVVGLVAQRALLSSFLASLGLPSSGATVRAGVLLLGIGLGVLAAVVACAIAALARRAARSARRDAALDVGVAGFVAAGVALALVVVIGPAGVIDSVEATLDDAAELELVDAQIAFAPQVGHAQLRELRQIDGVAVAEAVPSGNVAVSHGDRSTLTSLEAFAPDTRLQRFERPDGSPLTLPDSGVLVSASLARQLGATVGDELDVTVVGAEVPALSFPLTGTTSDTLGGLVFTSIDALTAAFGPGPTPFAGGLFNTAAISLAAGADADAVETAVVGLSDVEVYVPVADDLGEVARARPLLTDITLALLILGSVVALLTLLNVGLAAPGAFGARQTDGRRGARLVLTLVVPALLGAVVGAIGGTLLADRLVGALESSLVHLDRHIGWTTYVIAIAVQFAVVGVVMAVTVRLDRRGSGASTLATPADGVG